MGVVRRGFDDLGRPMLAENVDVEPTPYGDRVGYQEGKGEALRYPVTIAA